MADRQPVTCARSIRRAAPNVFVSTIGSWSQSTHRCGVFEQWSEVCALPHYWISR